MRSAAAVVLAFCCLAPATGAASESPLQLFADHDPLAVSLRFDPTLLCRKKGDPDCRDLPAELSVAEPDGAVVRLDVLLKARGGWRLDPGHCAIPPLFIIFPTDVDAPTGVFAGQWFLPLTTHCQRRPARYEQYVIKEYLAYRLYTLFSEASLETRLLHVTYHLARKDRPLVRYAFLSEHFDSLGARSGATVSRPRAFDPRDADPMELATLDLFQYMIGNTDWSVDVPHNVIFLNRPDGSVTIVPYDFDFAGLVDTEYATPADNLRINDVRRRLYRGYCLPGIDWEALFRRFEEQRDAVFAMIDTTPGLNDYTRRRSRSYIQDFYKTLESPRSRRSHIIDNCRKLPEPLAAGQ